MRSRRTGGTALLRTTTHARPTQNVNHSLTDTAVVHGSSGIWPGIDHALTVAWQG